MQKVHPIFIGFHGMKDLSFQLLESLFNFLLRVFHVDNYFVGKTDF